MTQLNLTMTITMTLQVQAVCNKLNLFIDDQQQLAETKTGPRYGFVIFSNFVEGDVLRGIMLQYSQRPDLKMGFSGRIPTEYFDIQSILTFKMY